MPARVLTPAVLVLLVATLLTLVVRYSFVDYLADANPELALRINGSHPRALLGVARRHVERVDASDRAAGRDSTRIGQFGASLQFSPAPDQTSQTGQTSRTETALLSPETRGDTLASARALTERALAASPVNHRALTLLGRIEELTVDSGTALAPTAARFYELAARLSPRATEAHHWLLRYHFAKREYQQAARHADLLMRTVSSAGPAVIPYLTQMAERQEGRDVVGELLAGNPPWRVRFFQLLSNYITDARTPLALLLSLKATEHPPSDDELKRYVEFLIEKKFHQLAYYTWLQFLSSDQVASAGMLYNGNFASKPSGFPFDWALRSGASASAELAPLPGETGRSGLRIDFKDGRVDFAGVSQWLLLAPGRYRLGGRWRGELAGRRGLRWRAYCDPPGAGPLGETQMHLGQQATWREFELELTIPEAGCVAQQLRLELDARSASERLVRGTIWYAAMSITKRAEAAAERAGEAPK